MVERVGKRDAARQQYIQVWAFGRLADQLKQFVRKAYSAKMRRLMTPSMREPMSILEAVLNKKPEEFPGYERLLRRKRREYEDQEKPFSDMELDASMANWVNQSALRYLSEFRDRLRSELLEFPVIQADETTCPVNKDGREGHSKSWMFVCRSGELYQDKAVIIYDYQKTRGAEHFDAFLQGYSGILVSDAYSGYHALDRRRDDIQIAHCWAHYPRSIVIPG